MKRLHYFNFFGVLALTALCVGQWHHDRQLNHEINQLEKARLDQAARLAEHEQNVRGLNGDLAEFKEKLTRTQAELDETLGKLQSVERHARQLAADRTELTASVTNWTAAVANRDELLQAANARIRQLADQLNASIVKFNDLATNYNAVVKDLNDLRARPSPPSSTRPAEPARAQP